MKSERFSLLWNLRPINFQAPDIAEAGGPLFKMVVSVQSTVDTGHEDMIHDAQMDYYGIRLATCSSDRTVRIFEVSRSDSSSGGQMHLADLHGHEGPVWQVAWAHPRFGSILASCSFDRKVIIWSESSPSALGSSGWGRLYELANHDSSVNSVCWAPQEYGLVLAAGASDGAISVLSLVSSWDAGTASGAASGSWEVEKIANAHTIGCNAVTWAPYSTSGIKRFASGGCDNTVKIWRFEDAAGGAGGTGSGTGRWIEEARLDGHTDWVRDVAWAPALSHGGQRSVVASCSQDRRVIIWTSNNSEGGAGSQWSPKELHTFDDVVWHVSWSISGNMLAVSGGDNKVSLWKETLEGNWVRVSDVAKGQQQQQQRPAASVATSQQPPAVAATGAN